MSEVQVWSWPIDVAGETDWAVLDAAETARAKRFVMDRHRIAFLRAHGGMRRVLGRLLGRAPERLAFTADLLGKPRLAGDGLPFFNLTHSGALAALAVCGDFDIGLDIEAVRPIEALDLADHFFSAEERAGLRAVPAARRLDAFFGVWTRKEAYLKCCGLGLSAPLDGFSVSHHPDEPARLVAVRDDPAEAGHWQMQHLVPAPGYLGTVAARRQGWTLRLRDAAEALP